MGNIGLKNWLCNSQKKEKSRLTLFILTFSVIQLINGQVSGENVHKGVDFIINKFNSHDIVAIGETHNKIEVTDFYIDLIGNKLFQEKVDIIVIEMGNHLFQEVLDDYINGKNVNEQELYKLWRNHTSCMLNNGDNTGLIKILKKVRTVNKKLNRKIRVLAGDPDIDWTRIKCAQEFYKYLGKRDQFYSDVVMNHVVKFNKKALLIMGNSHFNKQKTESMIKHKLDNPITFLQSKTSKKLYLLSIMSASSFPYSKLNKIKKGSIITTQDHWLGNLKVSTPFIRSYSLSKQTDAIIYLGRRKDLKKEVISPFNDKAYENELKRRLKLPKCNK